MASCVVLGCKGSSLNPSSVFVVANNLSQVQIDSSAVDKLYSAASADQTYQIALPEFFTVEQRRASLVVILNKLLLSSNGIRPQLPDFISEILNKSASDAVMLPALPLFNLFLLIARKKLFLDSSLDTLDGICGVTDHEAFSLCAVADLIAALSCEASKANVCAFNFADSGDGFTLKDDDSVASDLKVLLNGSKLVDKNDVSGVSCIPTVHGREELRKIHSRTRVKLNTTDKGSSSKGTKQAWLASLSALVNALTYFGKTSLRRAQANVDSVADDTLKSSLSKLLTEKW